MSSANPEVKNVDRPCYELPSLLQRLGNVSFSNPLTPDQRNIAEAARVQAHNLQGSIASGMDSIGELLYRASNGDEAIDPHHTRNIGLLISHLVVQLEHAIDADGEMETLLTLAPETKRGTK